MIKKSLAIVSCFLYLSSCSHSSSGEDLGSYSELGNSKYVIGFSNILEPGSEIALYNDQGEQLEDLAFPGFDLLNSVQTTDNIYIAGHRGYQHAKIERSTGNLSVLKHPESVDGYGGAYQMNVSDGYIFYDVNVGSMEESSGKYISYFVFGKENQEEKIVTELEGTVHTAFLLNDYFYVYTESELITGDDDQLTAESFHNFVLVDKETGEVNDTNVLPIEEDMYPTTTLNDMYTIFNNTIVISYSDNINQSKENQLIAFNWETEETEVVKTFPQPLRPITIIPYEETLIVVSETGVVKILDREYNEVEEYTLEIDFTRVMDFDVNQDQISFMVYKDSSSEFQGEISTFQLIDGQKLNTVPIEYKKDFEQAELIVVD
ncbi:hypothetical protein [Alkalicoccobacillus gibsonii]|uniref:hypothetical protein n=1 Tax=Alkalicoccobacillus gibsonii TaxID=79881 RepID=UPI0019328869|nr:hypothetical protein [Alkalicoccobacillus gibsonii]MBM0067509.1 hypothetical protein [Alkalicoccobacillus gibsonii]